MPHNFAGIKILIADRDVVFRTMLGKFLTRQDFDVIEAFDGESLIAKYKSESPSLILTSASLGSISGIDACSIIGKLDSNSHCPIIMITSEDSVGSIESAFSAGVTDYVTKPINWAVLKHRIRHSLVASVTNRELKHSEERFKLLFQESPLSHLILDGESRILESNRSFLMMIGYSEKYLINKSFVDLVHSDDVEDFCLFSNSLMKEDSLSESVFRMVSEDGYVIDVELNARVIYDIDGFFSHCHFILQDVTVRRKLERELLEMATTDHLTGLDNRRSFFDKSNRALATCSRYGHPFSILMIDVDYFKKVNDTYGHDVGDVVLRDVSAIMSNSIRDIDLIGRIGGEEFAIALPEAGIDSAVVIAERIRLAISATDLKTPQGVINVTVSIGISEMSSECSDVLGMLSSADACLYKAKNSGRNKVVSVVD